MESNCVVNEGGVETKRCEQKRVGRRSESDCLSHCWIPTNLCTCVQYSFMILWSLVQVFQPSNEVCSLCQEALGFVKQYVDNPTTEVRVL